MNVRLYAQLLAACAAATITGPGAAQLGHATVVPAPPVVVPPNNGTGPAVVQPAPPVRPSTMVLPAPPVVAASGMFRLVALSFAVVHQTVDDPLENDGAGDEIQIRSDNFDINAAGAIIGSTTSRNGVFGAPDRTDFRAGTGVPGWSAEQPVGGLITGNSYPEAGHVPLAANDLPMTLWQGTLSRGQKGELIIPTIWEMDGAGVSGAQTAFNTRMPSSVQQAGPTLGRLVANAGRALPPGAPSPGQSVNLIPPVLVFDDGSRPIGASTHPGPSLYLPHAAAMRLPTLFLTFDEALRIAARPAGPVPINVGEGQVANDGVLVPQGGILVQVIDRPELQGNYYVIMQLQRM